ncbi:MAG: hypothetical protein FWE15_04755 [Actinomycetia bacterium]|nr:hypothetical protein [Actinomycetes bacterium]
MIDPKTEDAFRTIIGHAVHGRNDDAEKAIAQAGQQAMQEFTTLAIQAAGYVVIDTAGRWPTDADLASAARIATETLPGMPGSREDVLAYLKSVVFSAGTFDGHPLTPLYAAAALTAGFKPPQGSDWNDWLDVIEAGIEAADAMRREAGPAVAFRLFRK